MVRFQDHFSAISFPPGTTPSLYTLAAEIVLITLHEIRLKMQTIIPAHPHAHACVGMHTQCTYMHTNMYTHNRLGVSRPGRLPSQSASDLCVKSGDTLLFSGFSFLLCEMREYKWMTWFQSTSLIFYRVCWDANLLVEGVFLNQETAWQGGGHMKEGQDSSKGEMEPSRGQRLQELQTQARPSLLLKAGAGGQVSVTCISRWNSVSDSALISSLCKPLCWGLERATLASVLSPLLWDVSHQPLHGERATLGHGCQIGAGKTPEV